MEMPPTPDESDPNVKKQIQKKMYQLEKARQASKKEGRIHSATSNLPPGQTKAPSWLVLDIRPSNFEYVVDESWSLEVINGETMKKITLKDLKSREDAVWFQLDFHCVTSWTYCGLELKGIPLRSLLGPSVFDNCSWNTMVQRSADKYTTTLPREAVLAHDAYLVFEMKDKQTNETIPLSTDHGGVRIIFPSLYGYKSAKWLTRLEFHPDVVQGFWESKGYHDVAVAHLNQRFSDTTTGTTTRSIMNPLNGWFSWYAINFPENFLAAQQCLSFDLRQSLFKWRFYWMVVTFWVCFPMYGLYYGALALLRMILKGQAIKYHAE